MKPIVIGIAAGLALGYLVGYNNLYGRQQNRVRLIRQQLAQEKADQQARKDTADLISQVEQYHAQLPSEPDPSWLVREARAAGQKSGVDITSISQQNPETGKQATALSVVLQINGT
jgi:Tfp pilus assembly protein PilO